MCFCKGGFTDAVSSELVGLPRSLDDIVSLREVCMNGLFFILG